MDQDPRISPRLAFVLATTIVIVGVGGIAAAVVAGVLALYGVSC